MARVCEIDLKVIMLALLVLRGM